MEKYELILKPGIFVTLDWIFSRMGCKMYRFTCADGSAGIMDKRTFHEFYKKVDTN